MVDAITIALKTGKAPMKHMASLIKPERPGKPSPAKKATAKKEEPEIELTAVSED